MENRCLSRELRIYIRGSDQDFYRENGVYGDVSHIPEGCSQVWEDGVLLKFEMDEVASGILDALQEACEAMELLREEDGRE